MAAQALVRHQRAPIFDAVGPLDHEGQRHAGRRRALGVAQQRGEISRLARAIDAALGIDEGIEAVRRRAAGDAAVGKIERGTGEVEEGKVALAVIDGDQRGSGTALPAGQARFELHMAAGIGAARRQHLVAARDQPHLDAGLGVGGRQRIDEGVDAVIAGEGREPEVGDDEPLGRQRVVIGIDVFLLLRLRHHDVDAGFEIADRLIDRKRRGDVGIERRRIDGEIAVPDRNAVGFLEPLDVGAVEALLEIAAVVAGIAGDGIDQIAIADAVDFDSDRLGVDADHRNAALAGARQHIGRGREPHRGLAVAHIDDEIRRFRQRLVHHRRQPGA